MSGPAAESRSGSTRNLTQALQECASGAALIDSSGRVLDCNRAFARLVGSEGGDLAGRPLPELIQIDDERLLWAPAPGEWAAALSRGPRLARVRSRSGATDTVLCCTQPLLPEESGARGLLLVVHPAALAEADLSPIVFHIGEELRLLGKLLRELARREPAVREAAARQARPAALAALTRREAEILQLLSRGLTPAAIANALRISVFTVRNHIRSIYAKLGVRSQLELLAQLFQS